MTFQPIQWARRSVEGRQIEADGSRLLNFYAVNVQSQGVFPKVPVMLYSSPGLRRWLKVPNPEDQTRQTSGFHALLELKSPIYGHWILGLCHRYEFFHIRLDSGSVRVPDGYDPYAETNPSTVYEVPAGSLYTFTTEDGSAVKAGRRAKMVTDGRVVLWTTRDEVRAWDFGATGGPAALAITAPVAADLSTLEDLTDQDWVDCAWVDGFFLLAARSGQFFHSNVYSTQFDQLDFADAGSNPDGIVGMEVLNRRIYLIGDQSIENWFNAGGADFAFRRNNSFQVNVGCAAKDTIAKNQFAIVFLGHDLIVYTLGPGGVTPISTESVSYDIARSDVEEAHGWTYTEEGHLFYVLTLSLPEGDKTWVYDFRTALWHERDLHGVRTALSLSDGRTLVGMDGAEHLFDQRLEWGIVENDDGTVADGPISREAISPVLFANLQRVNMASFHVDIPKREGDATDAIVIDWNDTGELDDASTWRGGVLSDGMTERSHLLDAGRRIRVNRMGQFRNGRNIRIRTSAKRRVDVLGAYTETTVLQD